jgi:queuine tRNA-ribosyltransferase
VNHLEKVPVNTDTTKLFSYCTRKLLQDLRQQSIIYAKFQSNAIGGLSVGEPAEEMYAMTE